MSQLRIAVLLATKNGIRFLSEQIETLRAQSVGALDVHASDDGSVDGTLDLPRATAAAWPKGSFYILSGPDTGNPADNFRSLILQAPEDYDLVAYCDQDDIWLPRKLERAAEKLSSAGPQPAVCCSFSSAGTIHKSFNCAPRAYPGLGEHQRAP